MTLRLNDPGTKTPVVHHASPAAPAAPPAPPAPSYGGGGGGGGGSSVGPYSAAPLAAAAAPVAPTAPISISPEQDPTYLQQIAALKAALANYNTDYTNNVNQYNGTYGDALKNLGWSAAGKGAVDNPATPDINESLGQWNFHDQNSAAGRGFTNQQNDFAGRGLLQSSYYAQALNDLQRSLNDQRGQLDTSKTNYLTKLNSDKTQYSSQNTLQQQNARAEALARLAAGITG